MNRPLTYSEYRDASRQLQKLLGEDTCRQLRRLWHERHCPELSQPMATALRISMLAANEMGLTGVTVTAILVQVFTQNTGYTEKQAKADFSEEVEYVLSGIRQVSEVYQKTKSPDSENFRMLLLALAKDVRVIMIMLAHRLFLIRHLDEYSVEEQDTIAHEVAYLYAPLAHRMGFYSVKTEMEERAMEHNFPETYRELSKKLNDTALEREAYFDHFVGPLRQKLDAAGFKYELKSRTKSIPSIWNKMKKQQVPFEGIYDLFAIRLIIDCPIEQEKAQCWQVYSIVTDMYTPDLRRMRDWLTQPKANGYESLHCTVMGPDGKYIEVQIRTQRMDEVAEKGVAAHWKYKNISGDNRMELWLKNLRDGLENPDMGGHDSMDFFKMNLYDEEVFAFTPKGDLLRLPKGASLLDFAFAIHTAVGSHCIGGRIDGRNVTLGYKINNGDQIEVLTSPTQRPRADWVKIAITTKARQKIRTVIKETETKLANDGLETLQRRFKNWKIELDEARLSKVGTRLGYKHLSQLYIDLQEGKMDLLEFRDAYLNYDKEKTDERNTFTATDYGKTTTDRISHSDVLIINEETKGVQYSMAKCCHPIFGDEIFGFVTVSGGIKIHRKDCPNAPQMMARFGYRIVRAAWEAKGSEQQICPIFITGDDQLSIMTNITSVIAKEPSVTLRSINIDADGGRFKGRVVLTARDTDTLERLIRKLRTVKGIDEVSRG